MPTLHRLDFSRNADKFISVLAPKQYKQIVSKILTLANNPTPQDSQILRGYDNKHRIDCGVYRVIYHYDDDTVFIEAVGKHNDDEVYRDIRRRN